MKKAILAFSGDPITYGHIDIIKRALAVFDEVTVGIGNNTEKKYMFTLDQRTEMAMRSLRNIPRVKVVSFEGLLVDYAYENEIPVIIKGVRNAVDFDYEIALHHLSESQKLDIDTFLLPARQDLSHISSSGVRALQLEQGLIHDYVPLYVKMCLEARVSGQYILGITGEIGAGKSYIAEKIEEIGRRRKIPVHHIELDHIGHSITSTLTEPSYENVRKKIAERFGREVLARDGSINRKVLGEIVFNNRDRLDELNELLYTPLLVRLRRELYSKRGIILFNAALIAESNMSYLSNNNVLLVTADKQSQRRRLAERDLSAKQIEKRLGSQCNSDEKKSRILDQIEKSAHGRLWMYDNSDSSDENAIEQLFDDILLSIDVFGALRFESMWERLGATTPFGHEYARIIEAYSGKRRRYHSISHVLDGLRLLAEIEPSTVTRAVLECAWWYHDVVYVPGAPDNEEQSAAEIEKTLLRSSMGRETITKIRDLILATKHDAKPLGPDEAVIADVDLSVLGRGAEEFGRYEENIRKEYMFASEQEYRCARADFLRSLIARKRIFHTERFALDYEKTARMNCERLIEKLAGGCV